jgi:hypothetical protein
MGWSVALDETGFRGLMSSIGASTGSGPYFGSVVGFVIENDKIVITDSALANDFQEPDISVSWACFHSLTMSANGSVVISQNSTGRVNDYVSKMPSFFVFGA